VVQDRPTGVLTCYRTRHKLGAYLDGALDERATRSAERHLSSCATCQGEVGQLRRIKQALAETAVPEPDWTGFWPGVVRGIERERHAPSPALPRRRVRALSPRWAVGGAAIASLAFAFVLWQGARGPAPAEAGVLVSAAATEHPRGSVMVYTPPERDIVVVWVFDDPDD